MRCVTCPRLRSRPGRSPSSPPTSAVIDTGSSVAGSTRPTAPSRRPASSSAAVRSPSVSASPTSIEVAERVVGELARTEPVLERGGPRTVVGRERDEARAQVAGRGDVEIAAQPARAAAVVGDAHDRGDLVRVLARSRAQRDRQAVPSAQRDDARSHVRRRGRRPGGARRCGSRARGTARASCSAIDDAAVPAAGAADADRQVRLAFALVARERQREQAVELVEELGRCRSGAST